MNNYGCSIYRSGILAKLNVGETARFSRVITRPDSHARRSTITLAVQTIIHFLRRIVSRKSHRGRLSRNVNSRCPVWRNDTIRIVTSDHYSAAPLKLMRARAQSKRLAFIARACRFVFSSLSFSIVNGIPSRAPRAADRTDTKVENYSYRRTRAYNFNIYLLGPARAQNAGNFAINSRGRDIKNFYPCFFFSLSLFHRRSFASNVILLGKETKRISSLLDTHRSRTKAREDTAAALGEGPI